MAGLFLIRDDDPEAAAAALERARAQFAGQGFADFAELRPPGWRLLHAPAIAGGPETLLARGEDFIAAAGTPVYDGRIGRPALAALLASFDPARGPDWDRLDGQFVIVLGKRGRAFLFSDWFAAFQIFHDAEMRFFSTSLLAAVATLPKASFDPQGVYEFVFNVVPVGDDTVLRELKTLGPRRMIELGPGGVRDQPLAKPLPGQVARRPVAEHVAAHRERLSKLVAPFAERFGDRIFCPLSGGLDSRLVLAALRAAGSRPRLYVYGAPSDGDVRVARQVAGALGEEIDCIDKQGRGLPAPEAFPAQVERNFRDHDGLPNFGNIFESGADAAARAARHAEGALSVSGGCGEIFRNFFYLPDRPLPASAVARAFFARYRMKDVTQEFDERAFLRRIEDKMLEALGRPGERGPLPRAAIEQLYPAIRCRSLFGREISLEARHGPYFMPFLEHPLVAAALTLPLGLKNAGRFEAMLLADIDPGLARLPSVYGHDFSGPPGFRQRLKEGATRARPIWLRQKSYALRRRLGPMGDEHGDLPPPEYLGRVIDLDFPVMRRFFRPEAIGDLAVLRRIANLEYLAARLGARLEA